ncbi:hypothetical protein [Actinoplanes subglobosus]|uniref:hypothetical protein n=1 Tax=Actinoplanes subglobosus TaxID=1547892 RepID=UPI00366FD775
MDLLLTFLILDDLDRVIDDQIRIYRHENRDIRARNAATVIAGRVQKLNCDLIAARLADGNARRKLYACYLNEARTDRFRHVAVVLGRFTDNPHRNAVLLLGLGGVTATEARRMTGNRHVDYDMIAEQLNLAMAA